MQIKILLTLNILCVSLMFSQNDIDIHQAMYAKVYAATLSFNDLETGKLLEILPPQTIEFIAGTNDVVLASKSVVGLDMFHYINDYFELTENQLLFPSNRTPELNGIKFTLEESSKLERMLWIATTVIREQPLLISFLIEPDTVYPKKNIVEKKLYGTWKMSTVSYGDGEEPIAEDAENSLLKLNPDGSYSGFNNTGHWMVSNSGNFLILESQAITNEKQVLTMAMPQTATLVLSSANDYQKTDIKFLKIE